MSLDLLIAALGGAAIAALAFLLHREMLRGRSLRLDAPVGVVAEDLYRHWRTNGSPFDRLSEEEKMQWVTLARYVKRVMVPLIALLLFVGCASPLDLARKDFAASLRVANGAQVRLRTYDAQRQADIVKAAKTAEDGKVQLQKHRERRASAVRIAQETEVVIDAVAEDLLYGATSNAALSAGRARQAAWKLRKAVADFMEGK